MFKKILMTAAAGALLAQPALAADPIKIGFMSTLTTPAAVIGQDTVAAAKLALAHLGGKMAGRDVDLIVEDDAFSPETGKQKTDKLVKQDKVEFVTGYLWSHILLASRKSALDAGAFLISANAGPHDLAGKLCDKNFFNVSWQNDQTPMALGEVLNQQGIKSAYLMAPNYAAGKDMVAGFERVFKGEVKGKDLTKWGADAQLDFSAELAKVKASGAGALFVFYPGKAGPALIQQYQQAGLAGQIPLYTVFTVDAIALPSLQKAGLTGVLGSRNTQTWSPDMDNAINQKFVADFKQQNGRYPSFYAAQAYDSILFINAAVEAVKGDVSNKDGLRAAMEKGFNSTRGPLKIGKNHFPVQNFYLREVVKDADGNWTTKIVSTVFKDHVDPYVDECKM
jgi:branched-chain amino acid transport system substrate-binding protein